MGNEHFFKHPGLSFAECRYSTESERHFKPHIHKTFTVGAIDQGEVIYLIAGKEVNLQPGSLALINPETLHSCNPAKFCKRSYYVLHLDVEWCLQLQQSLWQIENFIPVKTILLEDDSIYHQYTNTMKEMMESKELLEKEQLLVELTEKIFIHACDPLLPLKSEPSLKIEQLKLYLSTDLDEDISMRELSSELQANPYTLLRQFKAAAGVTPHAYRLNCRIELARKLLQQGSDLSQVALECGFFDQSHFHRHFKSITTVTPREYQVNFMQ